MIIEIARWICRIVLAISSLYGLYQTVVALQMFGSYHPPATGDQPAHRLAVLIFAKNEEKVIGNLIASLKQQNYPADAYRIFVTADNCTDQTAAAARTAGATVLERTDPAHKGKGYAMNWFFTRFLREYRDQFDACVIFDADNVVDKGFLAAMNRQLNAGHLVATGYRQGKNPASSWVAGCSSIFWLMQTRCFHIPRARLNLPCCSVGGTGFMFALSVLGDRGWHTQSVCEDIEFTMQCIARGHFIAYAPYAIFYDEQPLTLGQSLKQRYRWSLGSIQILPMGVRRLVRAMLAGRVHVFDDLMYSLGVLVTGLSGIFWTLLVILDAVAGNSWTGLLITLAGGMLGGYAMLAGFAWLILALEHKKWPGCWRAILTFPIYMFPWAIINILVLFYRNAAWHDIPHEDSLSIEDIDGQ